MAVTATRMVSADRQPRSSDCHVRILDAVRSNLEAAITVAGVPTYTASFGVVAGDGEDLPQSVERADAALYVAKSVNRTRVGSDRACVCRRRGSPMRWAAGGLG